MCNKRKEVTIKEQQVIYLCPYCGYESTVKSLAERCRDFCYKFGERAIKKAAQFKKLNEEE